MPRHLFSVLFFLLFASSTLCAQDIAYYQDQYRKELNAEKKLAMLDSVVSKSYMVNDSIFIASSIAYIELAKNQDKLNNAAQKAIEVQETLSTVAMDSHKAVSLITSVLANKYKITDSLLLGKLYYRRGRANNSIDLKKAIDDYTLAIVNYPINDLTVKGDCHLSRGHAHADLGKFILASEDYNKAYRNYEKTEDFEFMLYAQQGFINMYSVNGFYEKAASEREKYLQKVVELGLDNNLATFYYNQALDYKKMGDLEQELSTLQLALQSAPQSNSNVVIMGVNAQLLKYYAAQGDYDNSLIYVQKIKELHKSTSSSNLIINLIYEGAIAFYYYQFDELPKALRHAKTRYSLSKKLGHQEEMRDALLLLSQIYGAQGNYKESYSFQKEYIASKDSIFNQNNTRTLAYYQTLYETEKKEKALIERNKDIAILENSNQSFKRQVLFISLATVFLFGVILLFRNQKHLKNNKVLQEKFSQELIVSQENERIRISKDLHDGLGQRLLLIKNKLVSSPDATTKTMVDDAIDEVRTISKDLHPFQLQELGITKAIEHALVTIDENTSLFISKEIDNIDDIFTPEQEVNIYRILQEALNNVIKHASAEATKVSIMKLNKLIVITVKDNGVGFDFSDQYRDAKSLGLKTLLERTKFLNGQMKVQSIINSGTLIEFQIPIT